MENMMKTGKLGTLGAESRFTYGGIEWIALEARPKMTLCIAVDMLEERAFDENNKNDFAASSLRAYLNGEFLKKMVGAGADEEAFAPMVMDLTSDDGLNDYGTDTVKIGLISCDMYRHFRKIIPNASGWWWTCTPYSTEKNGYAHVVRYVISDGTLYNSNAFYGNYGVRPLCALKSEILVSYQEDRIKERRETLGEAVARAIMDGMQAAIENDSSDEEPKGILNETEQPKPPASPRKLGESVEGVSMGGCRTGMFECIRAAQEQFIAGAIGGHSYEGYEVDHAGLSAIVRAYEVVNAIDEKTGGAAK